MTKLSITKTRLNSGMLVSIVTVFFLTSVYSYLYNFKFGAILAFMFIVLPVLSYITIRTAMRGLRGSADISSDTVSKGDTAVFTVTIETDAPFFIPFLSIKLETSEYFTVLGERASVVSIWRTNPAVIKTTLNAAVWGKARLCIGEITAHDYFGLFEFSFSASDVHTHIHVKPELIESQNNELSLFLLNEIMSDDKDDLTGDIPSIAAMPGFTYRPYAPPDLPGRINWKLYARLDKLFVRENEYLKSQSPFIALDPRAAHEITECAELAPVYAEQRIIEGLLSHLISMVHIGLFCDVYIFTDGIWLAYTIANKTDIENFREVLTRYSFIKEGFVPDIPCESSNGRVVFTCVSERGHLAQKEGSITVCPAEARPSYYANVFTVNEYYDIINRG